MGDIEEAIYSYNSLNQLVNSITTKEDGAEGYYYYHKDPAGSITNLRGVTGENVVSYQYTDFCETTIYG